MDCYICLGETVHTSTTGLCGRCGQGACGRPPQRRDGQFHGDVCTFASCGRFFCEPHLHTHSHAATGVTLAFPGYAAAVAAAALGATSHLDDLRGMTNILVASPDLLLGLNRFLNFVSPGAAALTARRDSIRPDMFQDGVLADTALIWFTPEFFTRPVVEAVGHIATRSLMTALDARGETDALEHAPLRLYLPEHYPLSWGRNLPAESDQEDLARFLLQKRDEGDEAERLAATMLRSR